MTPPFKTESEQYRSTTLSARIHSRCEYWHCFCSYDYYRYEILDVLCLWL